MLLKTVKFTTFKVVLSVSYAWNDARYEYNTC